MIYGQYPYAIYDPDHIDPAYLRQLEMQRQQKHCGQQEKIGDMVKAISDHCNAARGLDLAYQQEAMEACLVEIAHQANIDKVKNGGS